MWNGRKCVAMAIAGAALAAAVGVAAPASAERRNNGFAGLYSADGASAFGGGLEDGSAYRAAPVPAPGRAHPALRRREPRRLE